MKFGSNGTGKRKMGVNKCPEREFGPVERPSPWRSSPKRVGGDSRKRDEKKSAKKKKKQMEADRRKVRFGIFEGYFASKC